MKLGTTLLLSLIGLNLIVLGTIVVIAQNNNNIFIFTTAMDVPLPLRYVDTLESQSYITDVEVIEEQTFITVDLRGMSPEEIDITERELRHMETYFRKLYNSRLTHTFFGNERVPFDCARDTITGDKIGIYVVNGRFVMDIGDSQDRCP